jgi:hypothetical protein
MASLPIATFCLYFDPGFDYSLLVYVTRSSCVVPPGMHSVAKTTPSTMQDFLSQLPAPLPLYILLELPDLKALYVAILSSPCLYTVFCQNAHTIFARIVERSSTLELVRPIMIYMHLLNNLYHAGRDEASSTIQWTELENAVTSTDFETFTCKNVPTAVIFHMVAQAVRIHDVAYFVIRSKLDYLTTLPFQKLANPQDRYTWPFREGAFDFPGAPLRIPNHLRDPSWVEESRVIRVLWVLCASWRVSQSTSMPASGSPQAREKLLNLLGLDLEWARLLPDEIVECLLRGPTLRSPDDMKGAPASKASFENFSTLQTYNIHHPPYSCHGSMLRSPPASPQFHCSPAICPPSSTESIYWGIARRSLSSCNNEIRWLRVARKRLDSPLQESSSHIFESLGFGIWDDQRIMTELKFRSIPQLLRAPALTDSGDADNDLDFVSQSDQMFRLLKVYEYQERREQEGWHR